MPRPGQETTGIGEVAFLRSRMPVADPWATQVIRALRSEILVGMRCLAALKHLRAAIEAFRRLSEISTSSTFEAKPLAPKGVGNGGGSAKPQSAMIILPQSLQQLSSYLLATAQI